MAILDHEHIFEGISYVWDQRDLTPEEKTNLGFPREAVIYTAAYCDLDGCTAVQIINASQNNARHIADIPITQACNLRADTI